MSEPLQLGSMSLRLDTGVAIWEEGQAKLSRKECALMQALWTGGERAVSKEEVIESVWQGAVGNRNRLVVALSRLKKKVAFGTDAPLEIRALKGRYLLSVRGEQNLAEGFILSDRVLNLESGTVQKDTDVQALTPLQRQLLTLLARTPNQFVSRDEVMLALWGLGVDKRNALNTLINRCRNNLEPVPSSPVHLRTKVGSGVGLFLEVEGSEGVLEAEASQDATEGIAPPLFVGRKETLEHLVNTLREGRRCLTLLGPGGGGKTRIVQCLIETEAIQSLYGENVTFCDLSTCLTGADVVTKLAEGLGLRLNAKDSWQVQSISLGRSLALRERSLVIVDNFEQLVALAEDTVGVWSRLGGLVQFVVTSRRRLNLAAEQVVALEPLPTEDGIVLFLNQARRLCPEMRFRAHERRRIGGILARLEGNPLAILLAAGQLQEQDFSNWAGGFEADPAQRVDLDSVLARSWNILSQSEQQVLVQSTVFRGGFTLEAAEEVLDPDDDWVDDVLQQLLDHSLLFVRVGPDGHYRYGVYETVRDFCVRREASGSHRAAASSRLLDYYGGNAEAWYKSFLSPNESTSEKVRAKLNPEKENLWAAFELGGKAPANETGWITLLLYVLGLEGHQVGLVLGVLKTIAARPSGDLRGPLVQTLLVLTKSLGKQPYQKLRDRLIKDETVPMQYRVRFQAWGWIDQSIYEHDFEINEVHFLEQLEIWTAPSSERSSLLEGLARLRGYQGQSKEAIVLYKEAAEAGQGHISAELIRIYKGNIGHRLIDRGCLDEGRDLLLGHLKHMRERTWGRLNLPPTVWSLGNVALARGEAHKALELFEEGRSHCRQTGEENWLTIMGSLTAASLLLLGEKEAARTTLASHPLTTTPQTVLQAVPAQIQGGLWLLLGEPEKAESLWASGTPYRAKAWEQVWHSFRDLTAPSVDEATWEQAKAVCTAPAIQIPRAPIEEDGNNDYARAGYWVLVVLLEELVKRKTPPGREAGWG